MFPVLVTSIATAQAFRGFLVRKSVRKITTVRVEVSEIKERISKRERVELMRKNAKERLKGIDVGSFVSLVVCNVSELNLVLNSGERLTCWIDYDASSQRLEIRRFKIDERM
ncbi:hypothetical protein C1H46_022344 [Malus baccata]|uniref:Legume lectin domain-containing protein n=1 Tax=Malus baccata TaxID=106549 RepID=A0A540LZZ1_MALBA|nr:hypothetical protein C1H46_022344 [Malus baccata]